MQAIEATGTINSQGHLQLDQPLNGAKDQRVRVIVLLDYQSGRSAFLKNRYSIRQNSF